ncbi:uncharacterized protein TNCV_4817121 [Trichonephila clavipes]|nr:uncharacterized protein TNCV_4817121 [Trichonephila clavipes]
MACATEVLQSKSKVRLDEGFNIEIITIRASTRRFRSLRKKDCCLLQRRAIALHQKTGVPQGHCGFEEIALFKQYLKIQVIVVSTMAFNQHKGFTATAHNMKGFDGQFILRWMLEQGQCPRVIPNGSKIMSDVDILRRCCKIFREQFQSVTGMVPFTYVTIASACVAVYRSDHIKPKPIAMIPVQGYCNCNNFSPDSIRWLDFVAHTEGHRILHALNGTGEPKISGYSVDEFCKETNTVYQYQVSTVPGIHQMTSTLPPLLDSMVGGGTPE